MRPGAWFLSCDGTVLEERVRVLLLSPVRGGATVSPCEHAAQHARQDASAVEPAKVDALGVQAEHPRGALVATPVARGEQRQRRLKHDLIGRVEPLLFHRADEERKALPRLQVGYHQQPCCRTQRQWRLLAARCHRRIRRVLLRWLYRLECVPLDCLEDISDDGRRARASSTDELHSRSASSASNRSGVSVPSMCETTPAAASRFPARMNATSAAFAECGFQGILSQLRRMRLRRPDHVALRDAAARVAQACDVRSGAGPCLRICMKVSITASLSLRRS